jgi:hypothetical protein
MYQNEKQNIKVQIEPIASDIILDFFMSVSILSLSASFFLRRS